MSSGHKISGSGFSAKELDRVLADPKVRRTLARPVRIDRAWDVSYLAGYSKDGRTIYIDRHLPRSISDGRRTFDPTRFLTVHERTEKAIIDALGWKYAAAHELATGAERRAVQAAGYSWDGYSKVLRPFIKADEHERLMRVPAALDLHPYEGESALLTRMRAAMRHPTRPGKLTKPAADYSMGTGQARCGNCLYFSTGSCTIVAGQIDPAYWCKFFKRR